MAWLIWLGYGSELIGIALLAWELRDRARDLRRFETTVVGVADGVLAGVHGSATGTVTPPDDETPDDRLDRIERELTSLRDQQQHAIRAAEQRITETIDHRVRRSEAAQQARLGQLRDLVVGTTGGVNRAATALAFLVLGLAAQLAAALTG